MADWAGKRLNSVLARKVCSVSLVVSKLDEHLSAVHEFLRTLIPYELEDRFQKKHIMNL